MKRFISYIKMPAIVINPNTHRVTTAKYITSPNADTRPAEVNLNLIVIHSISVPPGEYGGNGIQQLFTNTLNPNVHPYYRDIMDLRVSAHIVIRRNSNLLQFVPFNRRAWHAGESRYQGREHCNDFSIGIELEGRDDQPFETGQYRQLAKLVHALLLAYPSLSAKHIACHSDIAPGRKTDPGIYFERNFLSKYPQNGETKP